MSKTVRIFCKNNGKTLLFPMGVSLLEIAEQVSDDLKRKPIAAKVNNVTESLRFELYNPKQVEFIDICDASGMRVYVRTLTFLIAAAVRELYPQGQFYFRHSVSQGYYCQLEIGRPYTTQDIEAVKKRVREFSEAAMPIESIEEETATLIERFQKTGRQDLADLLSGFGDIYTSYCKMGEHIDYYYGALAASSAMVEAFDLIPYLDGLLLRIPCFENPKELRPIVNQPKMLGVFQEHVHWNNIMGLSNVGALNKICQEGYATHLIKVTEALQEKKIAQMADEIAARSEKVRILLVSGPSSSGKTTFSKRLSIQLMVLGIRPQAISLDDYFLDRDKTPRDENGDYDYESLYALDLDLFNTHLNDLLAGKEVKMPTYNFVTGVKEYSGKTLKLNEDNVLILEGIHALNPALLPSVPKEIQYKIYVSALTSISLDNHNRIPTTDNRLIRRIIRDSRYRGCPAGDTIARWPSVRAGEEKWIFPYQENADAMFNSALLFELSVLRQYVEPVLRQVPQNCPEYAEARRLLRFIKFFSPINDWEIPPTSLLREFVGGSSFRY